MLKIEKSHCSVLFFIFIIVSFKTRNIQLKKMKHITRKL